MARQRKSAEFLRRSRAAKRGWVTRRRHRAVVPDCEDMELAEARMLLEFHGLRVGRVTYEGTGPRETGVVIAQRPRRNTLVAPGTFVDLHLLTLEDEDAAGEWEFGFVYGERGHGVDVNVRVARRDGAQISATEAQQVMTFFRKHKGQAPRGFVVRGVQWSDTPGVRGTQEHSHRELVGGSLAFVLDAVAGDAEAWELRMGGVKR